MRAVVVLALVPALLACGRKGPPVPPQPRGPLPAAGLEVRQIGDQAEVSFRIPSARGGDPLQAAVRAELVRVEYEAPLRPPADATVFLRRGTPVAVSEGPFREGTRVRLADASLGALEGGLADWLVRYAVRLRDVRGRSSPLAVAPDLVLVSPPSAPVDLAAELVPEGVRLTWSVTAATGAGAGLFLVYRATAGESLDTPLTPTPLSERTHLDTSAAVGQRYAYQVRALADEQSPRRESLPSNVVDVLVEDRFAPGAPADLVAIQEGSAVRLFWSPSPDRDLAGYRVERQDDGGDWIVVAPLVPQATWVDAQPPAAGTVAYRVVAVDAAEPPNASPPSQPAQLEIGGPARPP